MIKTEDKMASTGVKRKGNFKLDIDDMERRLVEFRVSLDREKRRCQAAKMTDKFEKLLHDKLAEIGSQITTTVGGGGGGQQGQENGLTLTNMDDESAGRLNNLLSSAITMSARVDQLDSIHDILRKNLLEARIKRVRTAAQLPAGQAKPLEPLCGFCGSSFNESQVLQAPLAHTCNCGHSRPTQRQETTRRNSIHDEIPPPIDLPPQSMEDLRESFYVPNLSQVAPNSRTSTVGPQQITPPASAPSTPEVGEQAGGTPYMPNIVIGGVSIGGGGQARQQQEERQQERQQNRQVVAERAMFHQAQAQPSQPRQQQPQPQQPQPQQPSQPPPPQPQQHQPQQPRQHQPQQQQQQKQPQPQHQQPQQHLQKQPQPQQQPLYQPQPQHSQQSDINHTNASQLSSRFVMPSDESSTDSDSNSVRDVLNKLAHTPSKYHNQGRSSTPVQNKAKPAIAQADDDDDDDRPAKLVIDEQSYGIEQFFVEDAPKVEFLSNKSLKSGARCKKRPKRPSQIKY